MRIEQYPQQCTPRIHIYEPACIKAWLDLCFRGWQPFQKVIFAAIGSWAPLQSAQLTIDIAPGTEQEVYCCCILEGDCQMKERPLWWRFVKPCPCLPNRTVSHVWCVNFLWNLLRWALPRILSVWIVHSSFALMKTPEYLPAGRAWGIFCDNTLLSLLVRIRQHRGLSQVNWVLTLKEHGFYLGQGRSKFKVACKNGLPQSCQASLVHILQRCLAAML